MFSSKRKSIKSGLPVLPTSNSQSESADDKKRDCGNNMEQEREIKANTAFATYCVPETVASSE
ncbi:hypothetical protein N7528_008593 [Penicillium herquei]|nr:hypothetical protein N7528_008593 [Penicillium herquei]